MMFQWLSARGSLVLKWLEYWWNAISTRSDWWSCRRLFDGRRWYGRLENIRTCSMAPQLPTLALARRSQASGICKSFTRSHTLY